METEVWEPADKKLSHYDDQGDSSLSAPKHSLRRQSLGEAAGGGDDSGLTVNGIGAALGLVGRAGGNRCVLTGCHSCDFVYIAIYCKNHNRGNQEAKHAEENSKNLPEAAVAPV